MFPTNIKVFIAFQDQGSIKMIPQPQNEEEKSWSQFFQESLQPYQDMVNNPIYSKRLRNKLKAEISYTIQLIVFFKLSLKYGNDEEKYRLRIVELLQKIEQIAQELDKSIQ